MLRQSSASLLNRLDNCKTIPVIENRAQFMQVFDSPHIRAILLRHCNLFELSSLLDQAYRRDLSLYVNIDHIDGIHSDAAGLRYLADQFHVAGVISNHPKLLALAKGFGLETIQRIFAVDSTGLEVALETVDRSYTDLLDISPALVIPYVISRLTEPLPLSFIGSGLIQTSQQIQRILHANASGVAVMRKELWREPVVGITH
jgi:glycerol uptake operon antiterminator